MPSSPLADTPVKVTLALQLKLGVPTIALALKLTVSNLLSVLVVAVPSADVPCCPVGVWLALAVMVGVPRPPVASTLKD